MKNRKIVFRFLVVLGLCVTCLSSCEKAGTELADLMIIQGVGIDYADNEYTVTVEILNNEQSGSPGGDSASDHKTKIYSAKGKSVAEGLRLLTTKSGNKPLFAHNRVIVIGESLKTQKLSEIIGFFVRNYDSRASQILCVAKGKTAEQLIRAKLLDDTVKSEILENLLNESYNQSLIPNVRIIDAVNSLQNENMSLCIPAVTLVENGENEDYYLDGCAVFDQEGITMFINSYESEGLGYLNNDVKNGFFTETLPNGEAVTFLINKSKTDFETVIENGKLIYNLKINISCDLDEIGENERNKPQAQIAKDLKISIKKAVTDRVQTLFNKLKSESGGDCIGFCKIFELQHPKEYKRIKGDWKQVFSLSQVSVSVNVTIRRIGEETLVS